MLDLANSPQHTHILLVAFFDYQVRPHFAFAIVINIKGLKLSHNLPHSVRHGSYHLHNRTEFQSFSNVIKNLSVTIKQNYSSQAECFRQGLIVKVDFLMWFMLVLVITC